MTDTSESAAGPSGSGTAPIFDKESSGKMEQPSDTLSSQRVFKKSSPNSKLTLYLSSRDLVVSAGRIDRLQGVLLVDPEFVEDRKVYGQITLTFRYGREDEEVMGLKFCNEAVMCLAQLYPPHIVSGYLTSSDETAASTSRPSTSAGYGSVGGDLLRPGCSGDVRIPEGVSPLQEALLKRLGPNAYPFNMDITPLAPPSVQLVPAKEYTGAPIGTSYDIRAYIAERSDEKLNRRTTVRMGIRVVQRAFAPPSPYEYNPNGPPSTSSRTAKQHKITLFGCRSAPLDSSKLFPPSGNARKVSDSGGGGSENCGTSKVKSKSADASLEVSRSAEDDIEMKYEDKEDVSSVGSSSPNQRNKHESESQQALTGSSTSKELTNVEADPAMIIDKSLQRTKVEILDGTKILVNCISVGADCKSTEDNVSKFADDDDEDGKDTERNRLVVPDLAARSEQRREEGLLQCPDSEKHQMEQMRSMCSSKRPSLAVFIADIPSPHAIVEKPFLLSDGKVELEASLNKAVFHHGEEVRVTVHVRNNSNKTIRRIKVFIVQHVDVCMFSKGKFKNVVALIHDKDHCPLGPNAHITHTYSLIPIKSATKNWIALEDSYTKAGTSLASSVTSSTNKPDERNVFAIYVSYYVKIKLVVSVMGGVVALKLPFTLMHTCNDFDPCSTLTRVVMPPQLTLDLSPHQPSTSSYAHQSPSNTPHQYATPSTSHQHQSDTSTSVT